MWPFFRAVPIDQLLLRPPALPKKHLTNRVIQAQLERAIKVATARCAGLDVDVDHDAHNLLSCVIWVILGKHRSTLAPS
jgi:hypothetical protein